MLIKDMPLLAVKLPEDVIKAKWCGDFERAGRLIDRYCREEKTPAFLKKRLEMEREILERLPLDYGYSVEEGLAMIQQDIPDFTREELEMLMDCGKADWI